MFNLQDDIVKIRDSNDSRLRKYDKRDQLVTWTTFRRRVAHVAARGDKNVRIDYERNGVRYYTNNAELEPDLTKRESIFAQKLLDFRAFPEGDEKFPCAW